MLYWYS